MKIKGKIAKGAELQLKRCYLFAGVSLVGKCPNCHSKFEEEIEGDCIGYPRLGEKYEYGVYCDECGHEWEEDIIIDMTVRLP